MDKFFNGNGKYKPELNQYFWMYRYQLNFAVFCVTSARDNIFPNLLVRIVYRFHVYFYVRLMLHHLGIFYRAKLVLPKLKTLTLIVSMTVFVIMVLMQMKHG